MKENSFSMTPVIVRNKPKKEKADGASMLASGTGSALQGAAIGSQIAPGIGTGIGAGLGLLYGLYTGSKGGGNIQEVSQGMKDYREARSMAASNKIAKTANKLKPKVG